MKVLIEASSISAGGALTRVTSEVEHFLLYHNSITLICRDQLKDELSLDPSLSRNLSIILIPKWTFKIPLIRQLTNQIFVQLIAPCVALYNSCQIIYSCSGFHSILFPFKFYYRVSTPSNINNLIGINFCRSPFRSLLICYQLLSLTVSDSVIFLSRSTHDSVTSRYHFLRADKCSYTNNSAHPVFFSQGPFNSNSRSTDTINLVVVSHAAPYKNLHHLLTLSNSLAKLNASHIIYLAGDCESLLSDPDYLPLISQKRLILLGQLNRHDLIQSIQACDLAICTSSSENSPVSLIELMAISIPVVALDMPHYTTLLPAHYKYLYSNPESLCNHVLELMHSTVERERVSTLLKHHSLQYSWSQSNLFKLSEMEKILLV